jgi:acyl transferase domain-containing protein
MFEAGISMAEVNQSQTAVYEASMVDACNKFLSKDPDMMPQTTATGTAHAIMANRISWFFNFLGPSLHVDTACSSGMIALDLACQSLRSRDSMMVR